MQIKMNQRACLSDNNWYLKVMREMVRQYLSLHYSDKPGLAITIEYDRQVSVDTVVDMLMFIHRSDNTWRALALNFRRGCVGIRGRIVHDRWQGWGIAKDDSLPLRFVPVQEDVNRMHRVRDMVAGHYLMCWQHVYAYTLFHVEDVDSYDGDSDDWYSNLQFLGVGALRATVDDSFDLFAPELMALFDDVIW